jgi:hypothetical protein
VAKNVKIFKHNFLAKKRINKFTVTANRFVEFLNYTNLLSIDEDPVLNMTKYKYYFS